MFYKLKEKQFVTPITVLLGSSILMAAAMVSTNYIIKGPLASAASGKASSTNYTSNVVIGQTAQGSASSASYAATSGSTAQQGTIFSAPPAQNLTEAHVYPNPFKPGSGGQFDATTITFTQLTAQATIKIYTVTGQLVATIEKTNTTVDAYTWDATNDNGEDLASGVYIYLITNSDGNKATGKFSIIR